jgi:hypothetical protein
MTSELIQTATLDEPGGFAKFKSYLVKSVLWLAFCLYLSFESLHSNYIVLLVGLYLFSLPIVISGSYSITIQKTRQMGIFAREGWLFKALSGRAIRTLALILVSIVTSFLTIMQVLGFSSLEWTIYFFVIPVFWVTYTLMFNVLRSEIKPYLTTNIALGWTKVLCPVFLSLLYYFVAINFSDNVSYASLADAIEVNSSEMTLSSSSVVVILMAEFAGFFDGFRAYAISGIAQQDKSLAAIVLCIGNLLVYYNACSILSCFVVARSEYRRVFSDLTDQEEVQPVSVFKIIFSSSILTFLTFFIYVPLLAQLENYLSDHNVISYTSEAINYTVDIIDGVQYKAGTGEAIVRASLADISKNEAVAKNLVSISDRVFDKMRNNVDSYLDWYYSLTAEYLRIFNVISGTSEAYMRAKLAAYLQAGAPLDELNVGVMQASQKMSIPNSELGQIISDIKNSRRIEFPIKNPAVAINTSTNELLEQSFNRTRSFHNRLLSSAGGGAIAAFSGAILLEKTVGKIVNKSIAKAAAKALAKAAASKATGSAAGAGAGAAAGAAVGSVVPGFGTAIGAAVGGVIGALSVGFAIDETLLKLDEAVNREDYKLEILASIDESQREFNKMLRE